MIVQNLILRFLWHWIGILCHVVIRVSNTWLSILSVFVIAPIDIVIQRTNLQWSWSCRHGCELLCLLQLKCCCRLSICIIILNCFCLDRPCLVRRHSGCCCSRTFSLRESLGPDPVAVTVDSCGCCSCCCPLLHCRCICWSAAVACPFVL